MVATTLRWGALQALALCGLVAAGVMACASAQTPEAAEPGATADVLSDVRVERDDAGATVVRLLGPADPVFTAFERVSPPSVVVDLAGVGAEAGDFARDAGTDAIVESVTVSPFATGSGEPMTRVEIALAAPARYEVMRSDDGLAVHLWPDAEADEASVTEASADAAESMDDPWAESASLESDSAEEGAEASETQPEEAAPIAAAPAKTLQSVEVAPSQGGLVVHLVADGAIEETSAFTLENPTRLVLDLPGLASKVKQARQAGDGAFVSQIRVGAHEGKVRVVIDGAQAAGDFAGRRVLPVNDGLVIALGEGPELESTLAALQARPAATPLPVEGAEAQDEVAAQATPEAAPAAEGPVHVYGVQFVPQADNDRLVVLSSVPATYKVLRPDPDTIVLSLPGATIDPAAAVRISPQAGGPVSLVSAFQQPEVTPSEVRVVVKRASGLEPAVSQQGSLLFLDFAHTGVAATPPVFEAPVATTEAGSLEQSLSVEPEPGQASAELAAVEATDPLAPGAATPAADDVLLPDLASLEAAPGTELTASPAALEPPAAVDVLQEGGLIEGKEYRGRRISLDFKDVEIEDVLRLVAEVSDLNIIAGEEVEGKVTIRLVDVPWDQALDVILLTKGLGFVRVGNVLRIAPAEVLAQEEELRLQERRAKEKLEDLVVKLQPVNYANVDEISKMVQRLLSPRGTVNVDKRTSTLIIKDIAAVIDEATALVKAIDTQTPQVLIEAKIVEAALDFSRELGSVWSFGSQPLNDGFDSGSGPRRDLGGEDLKFNDANNVAFANPITSLATGLYNLNAFILDEKLNLNLQLQAAESNGDGKVISSPRVVTLDNREAKIEQGVSIPFQTFENGDAQLEFIDAVLSLKVTPHITADRSIIMDVAVTRNAPDDTVPTPTGSPAIAKNQAETETLVKDGQTLVIGGIYTVNKTERQSRVPYLHAIPILGAAFRSREVSDQRKELLIFVTPRVVIGPDVAS